MTTFFIGDTVKFSPAVIKRLHSDKAEQQFSANAKGTVVGFTLSALKVDFHGTWIDHENGGTVRFVPRKNMQKVSH